MVSLYCAGFLFFLDDVFHIFFLAIPGILLLFLLKYSPRKKVSFYILSGIFWGIFLVLHLHVFVIRIYTVSDHSMSPAFPEGILVAVLPLHAVSRFLCPVRPMDVVVFPDPTKPEILLMKRITKIHLPHSPIQKFPPEGQNLERDNLCSHTGGYPYSLPDQKKIYYFLAGDNKKKSIDSRCFGWIKEDALKGIVWTTIPILSP